MKLKFYLWIMSWSGELNSWAWRKQAAIVRNNNRKEEEDYLMNDKVVSLEQYKEAMSLE